MCVNLFLCVALIIKRRSRKKAICMSVKLMSLCTRNNKIISDTVPFACQIKLQYIMCMHIESCYIQGQGVVHREILYANLAHDSN